MNTIRIMRAAPPADLPGAPVLSGPTWAVLLVTPENPDNDEDPTAGRILKRVCNLSFSEATRRAHDWSLELQRVIDKAQAIVLNMRIPE